MSAAPSCSGTLDVGYLFVDPIYPDGGTRAGRVAVKSLSIRAIERALRIRDRL